MDRRLRDALLFLTGLTGVLVFLGVWVFTGRAPDPSLLVMFGAMMGLPAFLRADERKVGRGPADRENG